MKIEKLDNHKLEKGKRYFIVKLEGHHYHYETLRLEGRSDEPDYLEGFIYAYDGQDQLWKDHQPVKEQAELMTAVGQFASEHCFYITRLDFYVTRVVD